MVELTPADESAALHVWGPVLAAAPSGARESGTTQIDRLQLSVTDGADGAKVVRPGAYRWRYSGDGASNTVISDGRCLTSSSTYVGDGQTLPVSTTICPETTDPLSAAFSTVNALIGWGPPPVLTVVERDGQWFVSPVRSVAETVLSSVGDLDPDNALRVARSYFGDRWAVAPVEMWTACGVARPTADAPSATGEGAFRRCEQQLPDDYVGPYSPDGVFFAFGPTSGADVEVDSVPPPPDDELVGTTTVVPASTGPQASRPTTTVP